MKLALSYLILIAVAEVAGFYWGIVPCTAIHALAILILYSYCLLAPKASCPRLAMVLGLVSMLRFFSYTLPVGLLPKIYWHVVIVIPLWIAMLLLIRHLGISGRNLKLRMPSWRTQELLGLSGVPLSLVGYWSLRPKPLQAGDGWLGLVFNVLILMVCVGFTEEFLFRGILQYVFEEELGRWDVVYGGVIYTVMYFSTQSLHYILFMGLAGMFFSYWVSRSRSIWGVASAHGLMVIGMGLLWPLVFT